MSEVNPVLQALEALRQRVLDGTEDSVLVLDDSMTDQDSDPQLSADIARSIWRDEL